MTDLVGVEVLVWRETYLSVLVSRLDGRGLSWIMKRHVGYFERHDMAPKATRATLGISRHVARREGLI